MQTTALLQRLIDGYALMLSAGWSTSLPEALALMRTLATIEIALLGIWWAATGDNLAATAISKVFTWGVLLWIVTSIPQLSQMLVSTFLQWGLRAGGGVLTEADMRNPGTIFEFGAEVGTLLITSLNRFPTWQMLFNAPTVALTGILALIVWATFGWITLEITVGLIEFYMGSLVAMLLLPCGVFRHLASLAEKSIAYQLALGVKLAILALVVSGAQLSLAYMTPSAAPRLGEMLGLAIGVAFLFYLSRRAGSWSQHILSGVAALTAGGLVRSGIALGGLAGAAGIGGANLLGAGGRGVERSIQGVRALRSAAAAGGVAGVGRLGVVSAQRLALNTANRFMHPTGGRHHMGRLLTHAITHE